MKIKFIKASNYVLGLIFTLIGFSCTRPACMYGTPTADFEISGMVTDIENNPIGGISVSNERDFAGKDGVITDKDGNYKLDTRAFAGDLELTIEDVDGVENGEFETKKKIETFESSEFKGGEGWYEGKATRVVNIKLNGKVTLDE